MSGLRVFVAVILGEHYPPAQICHQVPILSHVGKVETLMVFLSIIGIFWTRHLALLSLQPCWYSPPQQLFWPSPRLVSGAYFSPGLGVMMGYEASYSYSFLFLWSHQVSMVQPRFCGKVFVTVMVRKHDPPAQVYHQGFSPLMVFWGFLQNVSQNWWKVLRAWTFSRWKNTATVVSSVISAFSPKQLKMCSKVLCQREPSGVSARLQHCRLGQMREDIADCLNQELALWFGPSLSFSWEFSAYCLLPSGLDASVSHLYSPAGALLLNSCSDLPMDL